MKLRIKHRLFLAFLVATGMVVVSMFVIAKVSFERSLLRYVNRIEQERLTRLTTLIEKAYTEHGHWDFLRHDQHLWLQLVAASRHETLATEPPPRDSKPWSPPGPPPFPSKGPHPDSLPGFKGPGPVNQMFEWRISLLNADRQALFPAHAPVGKTAYRPVTSHNRTVGYLGLAPPKIIIDPQQKRFAEEQHRAMTIISLIVAGSAALLAFPLSKRMVQRITDLAAATHRLTRGSYDIQVNAAAGDELGQLARDFNTLARTLESNEQLRRRWVADISHELRTPLAVLRGEIEAVQDGVRLLSAHTLDTLHGEVLRLERLVGDLYELSLSDINALQYRKADIDLADVLRQSIDAHRAEFTEKGLAMETPDMPPELPMHGDPERLSQLFSNLLKNTLRYTDRGGRLRIVAEILESGIRMSFQDSEPGVPQEALSRLFDRLYRVESSRNREYGGAGLGLALCKNIVEAHDGTIEAGCSPLGGLQIVINLPRK